MIIQAIRITVFSVALILITGLAYPFAVTAAAQLLFPYEANGSLIVKDGKIIGSELIAQNFAGPQYFHPRPSDAGKGYEGNNSGASNLGVTSKDLLDSVKQRAADEQKLEGAAQPVPADLVTASGSGLDPDITPEAALYQSARVAKARGLQPADIQNLVTRMTKARQLGILGMPRVNVLAINMELDKMGAQTNLPAK